MHARLTLAKSQIGIESFRAAYRALLETLLSRSGIGIDDWSARLPELLVAPLDPSAMLAGSSGAMLVKRGLRALGQQVAPRDRFEFE